MSALALSYLKMRGGIASSPPTPGRGVSHLSLALTHSSRPNTRSKLGPVRLPPLRRSIMANCLLIELPGDRSLSVSARVSPECVTGACQHVCHRSVSPRVIGVCVRRGIISHFVAQYEQGTLHGCRGRVCRTNQGRCVGLLALTGGPQPGDRGIADTVLTWSFRKLWHAGLIDNAGSRAMEYPTEDFQNKTGWLTKNKKHPRKNRDGNHWLQVDCCLVYARLTQQ